MLTTSKGRMWYWPDIFRAALEDRLSLPTVKEVHLVGNQDFPFSLIGNCKNIESLLLVGSFEPADEEDSAPLQLKSLTLSDISHSLAVDELHINKLQSLKCAESSVDNLSDFLGVCSETLNKLDIDLTYSKCKSQGFFSLPDSPTMLTTHVRFYQLFVSNRKNRQSPIEEIISYSTEPPTTHYLCASTHSKRI